MMLQDATASSLRHAALELHRLREEDRAWILGALTASQRSALAPLLADLVELGLPAGPSTSPAQEQRPLPTPEAASGNVPDDGSLLVLSRLLAPESPRLVAAVLAGRSPAWQSRLLGALDPGQATEVRQAMDAAARAPALQAAARAAIRRHALAEGRELGRKPSWLDRMRTRFGRGRTS